MHGAVQKACVNVNVEVVDIQEGVINSLHGVIEVKRGVEVHGKLII